MFRAREKKHLNDKQRAAVVSYLTAGWSLQQIADQAAENLLFFYGKSATKRQEILSGKGVKEDREQLLQQMI